jgi:hypothetical protein
LLPIQSRRRSAGRAGSELMRPVECRAAWAAASSCRPCAYGPAGSLQAGPRGRRMGCLAARAERADRTWWPCSVAPSAVACHPGKGLARRGATSAEEGGRGGGLGGEGCPPGNLQVANVEVGEAAQLRHLCQQLPAPPPTDCVLPAKAEAAQARRGVHRGYLHCLQGKCEAQLLRLGVKPGAWGQLRAAPLHELGCFGACCRRGRGGTGASSAPGQHLQIAKVGSRRQRCAPHHQSRQPRQTRESLQRAGGA